ncbi:MAG: phenylalanine--tRNA ligase subunit alpha, partial [Nanoarchaeota archaeon]
EDLRKHLNQDEVNVSIGSLKRKNAILFGKKITITNEGKKLLQEESKEELFLKKLPLEISKLDEKLTYNELRARKDIIKTESKKTITIELTNLGNVLTKHKLKTNLIESLNQEMLLKKSWKNKTFRRFNIQSEIPRIYPGRRHFVNEAINYIRKIWLELGFKEMTGNIVQSSFWNFDALFTAQDHPVRELQDTFFIKDPKYGNLPKELLDKVKQVHENGSNTNSKGWQYKFNIEESRKNVLRTHTTILSAKTISLLKKSQIPAKFFAVGRNYRNETVDWSHLFEFTQTEGIVIDENANLRNLLGYLKEFFNKLGYEKVRIRPAYFPYTEPSAEIEVFHPVKKQWIELGGAGIFRPEVVKPLLGQDIPVLAWGLGLERSIMEYYNIKDIRELYKNDLKQLREMKLWLK